MLRWMIIVVCFVAGSSSSRAKEAAIMARMQQRLRSPRSLPMENEVWLAGKVADHFHRDCLSHSNFLPSDNIELLDHPSDSSNRFQILQFINTNATKSALLAKNDLVNATVWIPSHTLQRIDQILFLRCQKEIGKITVSEVQYRWTGQPRRDTSGKDGRSFDVTRLFNASQPRSVKADLEYFVAILHFSPDNFETQLRLSVHAPGSTEKELDTAMHISALPKPYLHLVQAEPKMPIVKKSPILETRFCEDVENETDHTSQCCLRRLEVNFTRLGWHWIAEPETMDIRYCDGYCPHPYGGGNSDTIEASFLTFLAGARPATGQLCCVPSDYRPRHVSVRTSQFGRIVIRSVDDIDATGCACIA